MTLYCGTHNWLCVQKMLNHGLNHGFFLSLFKLISFPIHWIVCVLACSYIMLALQKDHASISSKERTNTFENTRTASTYYIFSKNWFLLLDSGHFYVDPLSVSTKYLDSCFWNLQAVEASWYVTLRWLFHSRVLFAASPQWVQIIRDLVNLWPCGTDW